MIAQRHLSPHRFTIAGLASVVGILVASCAGDAPGPDENKTHALTASGSGSGSAYSELFRAIAGQCQQTTSTQSDGSVTVSWSCKCTQSVDEFSSSNCASGTWIHSYTAICDSVEAPTPCDDSICDQRCQLIPPGCEVPDTCL